MENKEHAPGAQGKHAGTQSDYPNFYTDKDSDFLANMSYHQRRVYNLLSDGVPRSTAEISAALRLSDPRSLIRYLRGRGIVISDIWCDAVFGGRFKRYFMRKEVRNE